MTVPRDCYSGEENEGTETLEVAPEEKIKQTEEEALAMIYGIDLNGLLAEIILFDACGLFNDDERL